MKLDHIALRVQNLMAAVEELTTSFGFEVIGRYAASTSAVEVVYLGLSGVEFEVFEDKSLPAGIDHIAIRAANIEDEVAHLQKRGVKTIGSVVKATRNADALWIECASMAGLRLHLTQRDSPDQPNQP